jgi:hypothetical protein
MPNPVAKRPRGRPRKDTPNVSVGPDATPLEYMLAVMRDDAIEPLRRDKMAISAAPYMHERVVDTAIGKKEQRAERAQVGHVNTEWGEVVRH